MENYAAWWQLRNKQPDTLPEPKKPLKSPEISVKIAGVICSTSPDNCRKITDDNV